MRARAPRVSAPWRPCALGCSLALVCMSVAEPRARVRKGGWRLAGHRAPHASTEDKACAFPPRPTRPHPKPTLAPTALAHRPHAQVIADPAAPRQPPVDVFAFGVVLLEMVQGRNAYSERHPPKLILREVLAGKRPHLPSDRRVMPPDVAELICQCWAQDARARPTFVQVRVCVLRVTERATARVTQGGSAARRVRQQPRPEQASPDRKPRAACVFARILRIDGTGHRPRHEGGAGG